MQRILGQENLSVGGGGDYTKTSVEVKQGTSGHIDGPKARLCSTTTSKELSPLSLRIPGSPAYNNAKGYLELLQHSLAKTSIQFALEIA